MESAQKSEFFRRSATSIGIDGELAGTIEEEFSEEQRKQIIRLLHLFENPLLNFLLNGKLARFSEMNQESRERYLFNFASSSLALKRTSFQALKRLVCFTYYGYVPQGEVDNPSWFDIGYRGREPLPGADTKVISSIVPEGQDYEFQCDVCIVGSGAGGSIMAAHLSAAGWKVIVVEAGEYLTSEDFRGQEYEMTERLFRQKGRASTRDLSFSLLEGRAAGGSTIVNWNTSIQPEAWLRKEWEKEGIFSRDFDSDLEFIWKKLKGKC